VKVFLVCFGLLVGFKANGIPKTKKETKKISTIATTVFPKVSPIKLNTQFGFNLLSETGIISGFQMGWLVSSRTPIYVGPELNFMLFSPGSILNVLLGGWVENDWLGTSKKTIDLGFVAGAGFSEQQPKIKTTSFVALFDIAYTHRVDDSLSLRGQMRPGFIDGKLFASLSFNAQFGFL